MMESFDNNDDNILDTPFVKFKAKGMEIIAAVIAHGHLSFLKIRCFSKDETRVDRLH